MTEAVREWAQSAYASHILAGILPEIARAQDVTRPVKEIIAGLEEVQRTFEQKVRALSPGETVKFYIPVVFDKETLPKYIGVSRWRHESNMPYQVNTGTKIINYASAQWRDLDDAVNEVREMVETVHERATKTLRTIERMSAGTPSKDTTIVELNLLRRECLKYTTKPKAYAAKAVTTTPVDLTGWKYVTAGSPLIAEINKEIEKRNKRREDAIERGAWELTHAQEAYDQLVKGEPLDAAQEFRLDQDSAYWTAHRVRVAVAAGARPTQAYAQFDVPVEGKPYSAFRTMPVEEARKYMEPLLAPSEVLKALAVKGWAEINLILDFKGHDSRGGQWYKEKRELQIDVAYGNATSLAEFNHGLAWIAEIARHEVQHVGQDILREIRGLREDAGLPSKSLRDPSVTPDGVHTTKNQHVNHALRDVEFYTDLSDAVDSFEQYARKIALKDRAAAVRAYVGLDAKSAQSLFPVSKAFLVWKKGSPPKWQKAVAEFVKELEKRGVRLGLNQGMTMTANRVAALHLAGDASTRRPLYSAATRRALLHAFGPRVMVFFDFYDLLRGASLGDAPPVEGYVETFRAASRLVFPRLTSEATRTKFTDITTQLRPLLAHLDQGQGQHALYLRLANLFSSLVADVAGDRGVFLSTMSSGQPGWVMFRVMSEREQKLEELHRNDPAMYDSVMRSRTILRELDKRVEKEVVSNGLTPGRKEIMGRPVTTGTDPITGDELVFDIEGGLYTIPEYVTKRRKDLASRKALTKVFPNVDELRKLGDEEINLFTIGTTEYVAMTDDKAKAQALTRIYPVRYTIDGEAVVVSGRYKGIYLSDMVNRSGRMVEGVAYDVDPKSGVPVPMETRTDDGTPVVRTNREPYVTLGNNDRLFLRIPSGNKYTSLRTAIAELAKLVPSLKYEEGSRKSAFTFEPKDFAAVREALGGLALSKSAAKFLQDFFQKLAKHELALAEENLQFFDTDKIGGFKPGRKLFHKQKQAMAWLESRGHSGVIALDTGLGKTMTAIASMQKMIRDGLLEDDQEFLYVCPPALRGNLPKEIESFIGDPKALRDRVKIMSYAEFEKAVRADATFASHYAAVFFDEAQALKNPTSGASAAALKLNHPRKILLTASPMEKSPMEVFVLVAIANNLDLNTPDGRSQMRAFRARFCEEVGGKIIGIKNDPVTARDFRVWVKQNLFFADKRDVEEVALPSLRLSTIAVLMDPEVETLYRGSSKNISDIIKGMVAKYRDRDPDADDPAIEAARVKLSKELRVLFNLINFPERVVPGAQNPKFAQMVSAIDERVGAGRRTLLFTDSPELAKGTAKYLSERFPVHLHAECLASTIRVWQSGAVVQTYIPKAYKEGDRTWPKGEWKGYILDRVISPKPDFLTCTLTSTYATGQNLQSFDTVIHLDRDSWNNEIMKQRTARAWRHGQTHAVDEIILDAVYAEPDGDADTTIDQIAGYLQGLESELFDRVIIESQSEALGKEWFGMKRLHSSFVELNRRVLELSMSPYATRLGGLGVQGSGAKA